MGSKGKVTPNKIKRATGLYNALPNIIWTGAFLAPAAYYAYASVPLNNLWPILAGGTVFMFLPNVFFDRIQLSRNALFYQRLGIRYVNHLAQNGSLLNKLIRKRFPEYRAMPANRKSIRIHYFQTYFFEKFHFSLFLIYVSLFIYAIFHGQYYWAIIIIISNIPYNVYPNLLQQYIRLKLRPALKTKLEQEM